MSRGANVRVAVLDSGVATLDDTWADGFCQVDADGAASTQGDTHGHGTCCASLIGSRLADAPGVAPHATIVSINVAGPGGAPAPDRVRRGFATAVAADCDVISCSFVIADAPDDLLDAVRAAQNAGRVVVAASGNNRASAGRFPERTKDVIVVGSFSVDGDVFATERLGAFTDIFAPGEQLRVVQRDATVTDEFGNTSGAAALVSGVVALALSTLPRDDRRRAAFEIEGRLKSTASRIPSAPPALAARRIEPISFLSTFGGVTS